MALVKKLKLNSLAINWIDINNKNYFLFVVIVEVHHDEMWRLYANYTETYHVNPVSPFRPSTVTDYLRGGIENDERINRWISH